MEIQLETKMQTLTQKQIEAISRDLEKLAKSIVQNGFAMGVTDKDIRREFSTMLEKWNMS
jgi:ribosomal protein S13